MRISLISLSVICISACTWLVGSTVLVAENVLIKPGDNAIALREKLSFHHTHQILILQSKDFLSGEGAPSPRFKEAGVEMPNGDFLDIHAFLVKNGIRSEKLVVVGFGSGLIMSAPSYVNADYESLLIVASKDLIVEKILWSDRSK